MDPATSTTVLLILGSAFGVMFATMTTLLVVSIRVQHRESIKIRTEVGQQIEQAFNKLRVDFTEILDARFSAQDARFDAQDARFSALESGLADLKRTVEHNHQTTQNRLDRFGSDLADVRERLARIEGHLGIGLFPQNPAERDESDSDAA